MSNISIQINDIQFRTTTETNGEFLCWSPNSYYGKLEEYLKNGWVDKGDRVVQTEPYGSSMSKTLFELKETCYVVAWLKYDNKNHVCDLKTVGDRLLRLENVSDFMEVYKIADRKMMEMNTNQDEQ